MKIKTKRRDTICDSQKEKLSRSEFEKMSALYDELYEKADRVIKRHNPCRISRGRCLAVYPCCDGCKFLSKIKGCLTKSLACKLWLCEEARKKYPACAKELSKIEELARRNPLLPLAARVNKEDIFSNYEIVD